MNNLRKYQKVFITYFEINENQLLGLSYQSISNWDSVGHMSLITALEEEFNIMMDTDDIIEFSTYEKGMEILEKYHVNF